LPFSTPKLFLREEELSHFDGKFLPEGGKFLPERGIFLLEEGRLLNKRRTSFVY
jgi:hypothetical protein